MLPPLPLELLRTNCSQTSSSESHSTGIRLIKSSGSYRTAALAYNSQRDWVNKAFIYAGAASQKKIHTSRSSGEKTAKLKSVSEYQIRRAGRWNQEQMGRLLPQLPAA